MPMMTESYRPPFFAGTELAARIERVECRLVGDCAEAIARQRPDADVFVRPIAGGVATFTGPGSPLNKVAGLGFAGPPNEAELEQIERAFAERKTPVQVELSNLADPSIAMFLTKRGYTLIGFENVLGLRLESGAPAPAAREIDRIDVARCGAEDFETWLDIVARGFAAPDAQGVPSHESVSQDVIKEVVRDMAGAAGFACYMARRDGVSAGGASIRTFEGVAHLCGAATLPEHRRRGVQTAMLAMRLREAARLGCDLAVIVTLPGSKSQQNSQKHGFELLYTRAILLRGTDA